MLKGGSAVEKVIGNVVVQKRGLVSLSQAKKYLGIKEGDILQVAVEDNRLVLVPMKLVPADQAWFWTEEWQKGEQEAQQEIEQGKTKSFDSMKELLEDLEK
jgi:bifunctional DNA-binding transcriptional regulator/antitoxin component of YhaV-PrlF toxin-antitoxin module